MTAASTEAPLFEPSATPKKRFSNLRSVLWRIDLGILPNSPSASVDDLRRVAADTRRRYASLRRRLLVDPHVTEDGSRSSDLAMDNPLSQNPESTWGRFFKNAELEKMVDQDLSRLYPEDGSYFQTSACQTMLRRVLLVWCLRHPEYGYRQGMHELLAPLVYVLHIDLCHLSEVRNLFEDCFNDDFDEMSFRESDLVSNYRSRRARKCEWRTGNETRSCSRPIVQSLDELDHDVRDVFFLSDSYGAEGELGVILSERFMEHDAYCMFDALMSGAHGVVAMADFFSSATGSSTGLPPIIEASSALYHLLSLVDSSLHSHLVDLRVEPQYFALRWLRVLFGREFCLEDLLVIWDELFSFPNGMCIDNEADFNFKILCSSRGAFIAAFAVTMLLQLRNSLLATENPTSCLQKLLNFPKNSDLKKLIGKAKSLQGLALDSNISSSPSQQIFIKNKLAVSRGYSLPSSSPKTPLNPEPDSYWEEKWRVLHTADELQKGSNNDASSKRTVKKLLIEKLGLSRAESLPSSVNGSVEKEARSSVRRRLLDGFSPDSNPVEDIINSELEVPAILHSREPLTLAINDRKQLVEELADENIIGRTSGDTVDDACLSGENASVSSLTISTHSQGNDHEESEKSSVASNSFVDNDEASNVEEPCSQTYDNQPLEGYKASSLTNSKSEQEQEEAQKEHKPVVGRFQWLWKFGRASGEGNLDSAGSQTSPRSSAARDMNGDTSSTLDSCEVSREIDVGDKKVMGTLKNLGQSMLEHIQVIETVFQQDRGQSGSLDNLSNHILGAKGQVTAMAALKELRNISNLLREM